MALYDRAFTLLNRLGIRGKDRLFSLFLRLGYRKLITFKAKYDIMLHLDPYEYIDSIILREGFYESEVTDEILNEIKDGETFWDIGANIGIHSLAVKKKRPNVNVFCFEPNPKVLSHLYNNVRLNGLDINICGFALFEKNDVMTLNIVDGNSGMSTLTPWQGINFSYTTRCLTTTGDSLIAGRFPVPAIIKIDTEGAELGILKGCREILSNPLFKKILFEAGNDLMTDPKSSELVMLLDAHGFKNIRMLSRNESTGHALSNFSAER